MNENYKFGPNALMLKQASVNARPLFGKREHTSQDSDANIHESNVVEVVREYYDLITGHSRLRIDPPQTQSKFSVKFIFYLTALGFFLLTTSISAGILLKIVTQKGKHVRIIRVLSILLLTNLLGVTFELLAEHSHALFDFASFPYVCQIIQFNYFYFNFMSSCLHCLLAISGWQQIRANACIQMKILRWKLAICVLCSILLSLPMTYFTITKQSILMNDFSNQIAFKSECKVAENNSLLQLIDFAFYLGTCVVLAIYSSLIFRESCRTRIRKAQSQMPSINRNKNGPIALTTHIVEPCLKSDISGIDTVKNVEQSTLKVSMMLACLSVSHVIVIMPKLFCLLLQLEAFFVRRHIINFDVELYAAKLLLHINNGLSIFYFMIFCRNFRTIVLSCLNS